jgi:hypothetical protein
MQCGHPPLEVYEKWHPRDYTDFIVRLDPAKVTTCSCGAALSTTLDGQVIVPIVYQAAVEAASQVRDISQAALQRAAAFELQVFEPQFRYPSSMIRAIKLPVRKRLREDVHRELQVVERNQGSLAVIRHAARQRYFGKLEDSEVD